MAYGAIQRAGANTPGAGAGGRKPNRQEDNGRVPGQRGVEKSRKAPKWCRDCDSSDHNTNECRGLLRSSLVALLRILLGISLVCIQSDIFQQGRIAQGLNANASFDPSPPSRGASRRRVTPRQERRERRRLAREEQQAGASQPSEHQVADNRVQGGDPRGVLNRRSADLMLPEQTANARPKAEQAVDPQQYISCRLQHRTSYYLTVDYTS